MPTADSIVSNDYFNDSCIVRFFLAGIGGTWRRLVLILNDPYNPRPHAVKYSSSRYSICCSLFELSQLCGIPTEIPPSLCRSTLVFSCHKTVRP
jgi:hypothetical protein